MHAPTVSSELFCGRVPISQTRTQWDREEGFLGELADSGIRMEFISAVKFTWVKIQRHPAYPVKKKRRLTRNNSLEKQLAQSANTSLDATARSNLHFAIACSLAVMDFYTLFRVPMEFKGIENIHALTVSSELFCGRVLISQTSTQWDVKEGFLCELADSGIRMEFISSTKFTWGEIQWRPAQQIYQ
ncbi:hypothetical protein CEXT_113811 [Caerostris extrusa]|uniref:Uncharacterized protein n=1 Tax=Caerostris extrusa TaxID=172846 RepID=A0AAV4PHA3_CAEEX|nr:hypothetical protein CEXT_113811 [Caerostris extrusa]